MATAKHDRNNFSLVSPFARSSILWPRALDGPKNEEAEETIEAPALLKLSTWGGHSKRWMLPKHFFAHVDDPECRFYTSSTITKHD